MDLVLRDFNFDDKVNYVLVGVRQSGKSYLMFQHIKSFFALSKKMDYKNLMIITFAEKRTLEINGKIIEVVPVWKWIINK